jgi:rhodanese-related sulfurtransferase
MRTAVREAGIIIALAVVFGFGYTLLTGRGLFGPGAVAPRPPAGLQMISVDDAKAALADPATLFVDSRHPFEFSRGHLPHAVNIPLADLDADPAKLGTIPRDRKIIVYCDGAECNSSLEVAARMLQAGFADVRVFFGGWQEWQAQHLPLEGNGP